MPSPMCCLATLTHLASCPIPTQSTTRITLHSSTTRARTGRSCYGEGLFVGYRYYDAKDIEPLFPFGYGLSYTTFAYENLVLSSSEMEPGGTLQVQVDLRNTGARAGKEVAQLYVRDLASRLVRPPKELKGFQKVALAPGEVKTLTFTLTEKELSYYDPA